MRAVPSDETSVNLQLYHSIGCTQNGIFSSVNSEKEEKSALGFHVKMFSKSVKCKQGTRNGCVCDRGNIVVREKKKTRTNGCHKNQTKPAVWLMDSSNHHSRLHRQCKIQLHCKSVSCVFKGFLLGILRSYLSGFQQSRSKWSGSWNLLSWGKIFEQESDTVEYFKEQQNWLPVCLPCKHPKPKGKGQGGRSSRGLARRLSPGAARHPHQSHLLWGWSWKWLGLTLTVGL